MLHQSLAEVEAERRGDKLHEIDANALADTLADNLEVVNAGKISKTLKDLKATSLVVSLAPTVAEIKAKTACKTQSDTGQILEDYTFVDRLLEVEAEALVYTEHHTFSQLQAKSVTNLLTRYKI